MTRIQLRDFCGARSGDKGDISDLSLFADDEPAYEAIRATVTVERYEAPNVLALKFVMHDALGGGAPRSLRADNLGKTMGASLLRMWVDVPAEVADGASRRRAPLPLR